MKKEPNQSPEPTAGLRPTVAHLERWAKKLRMAYESEVRVVEAAIEALKGESPALAASLASEQRAAATGLEYYGITKTAFERVLKESSVSSATAIRLKSGVDAVRRMFTS